MTIGPTYESLSSAARQKAMEAIHSGHPVRAKEWLEAAASAESATAAPKVLESMWLRMLDQLRGQLGDSGPEDGG